LKRMGYNAAMHFAKRLTDTIEDSDPDL
jgi:hypothetical protein